MQKNDNEAVEYDGHEVQFMNHMVRTLFDYLPNDYRKLMRVSSRPMRLRRFSEQGSSDDGSVAIVPVAVNLWSPKDDKASIFFALNTVRSDMPSELVEGKDYRSAFEVTVLNDKEERQYVKIEEDVFDSINDDYSAINVFLEMALPFIKDRFGDMNGGRVISPSLSGAASITSGFFMEELSKAIPDDWYIMFQQPVLDGYNVPFVESFNVSYGDDHCFKFPMEVIMLGDMVININIPDIECMLTLNLIALPETIHDFMRDRANVVVKYLVEYTKAHENDKGSGK